MKSKTSCFNRTIFTKNITMFWPLWVVYLAYLICSEPLLLWRALTADYYSSTMDATSKAYNIMESAGKHPDNGNPDIFICDGSRSCSIFLSVFFAQCQHDPCTSGKP